MITEMKQAMMRVLKVRMLVYFINGRLNWRKYSRNSSLGTPSSP